jgi:Grx4 family monothiol glutaredoxin
LEEQMMERENRTPFPVPEMIPKDSIDSNHHQYHPRRSKKETGVIPFITTRLPVVIRTMSSIIEYTSSSPPPSNSKVVLLFWADWHEDAVGLKDGILPALAASTSTGLSFGSIEAESSSDLTDRYGVTVVPTIVLVSESGEIYQKLEGQMEIADITSAVQRLISLSETNSVTTGTPTSNTNASTAVTAPISLETRLKNIINTSEVMIFMKGTPTAPKCGFSRQVVEIMEQQQIAFSSFDILSDEDVRQGLKTYSDWPTYPQIYCRGELIGGLDILMEMVDEGNLSQQLQVATHNQKPTSLDDRLKQLTNKSRIMLFMKGLPSAPKCGFSRQIVELLEKEHAAFDTFNILDDDEVRQGLKKYSDWPTFPQLYVDGDLIGGLDIVKEMIESGDFADLVRGSEIN